jgi:hypothetical protein
MNESELKLLLLKKVHGCIHRTYCTTGCPQRELRLLEEANIDPAWAKNVLDEWHTSGEHKKLLDDIDNPFIWIFMADLSYKAVIINRLERKQSDKKRRLK